MIAPTYIAQIYIGGDLDSARHTCRSWCYAQGDCVTVEPVEFVYTGAAELGVRVGFINYPRFPRTPEEIWDRAWRLAELLMADLHQHSFTVVASDKTEFFSRRTDTPSPFHINQPKEA